MAKQLKLMADYHCWPLWLREPEGLDNIDPADLPLDADTIQRLLNWAVTYDSKLNIHAPASSGFSSEEGLSAFEEEGGHLWKQLRNQLHPDYEIRYQKVYSAEELADPEHDSL